MVKLTANENARVVYFRPTPDGTFKVDLAGTIANPGPLGLFAFALTTALLSVANAGLVELNFENVVWCYALFWGGATQTLAGLLEFFKKNLFPATVFSTYGAFWMGLGLFQLLAASKTITVTTIQLGMTAYFAVWGILTIVYFIGAWRISIALSAVFVPLIPAFFCLLGAQYSATSRTAAGWLGILAAIGAFYVGAATFLNEMYGFELLPLGHTEAFWNRRKAAAARDVENVGEYDNVETEKPLTA